MQNMENKTYYVFFNAQSGGNKGQQILKYDQQQLTFEVKNSHLSIKFYNLCDVNVRNIGFEEIKTLDKNQMINIVAAGGDGSIMWVVGLLIQHHIDINQCVIIPFPLGTGNDFSNTLGWGTSVPDDLFGKDNNVMKGFVQSWNQGAMSYFDVWELQIVLQQDGFIGEIKRDENGSNEQKIILNNNNTFIKPMINYFSIGVDARIGYGFDKNRTTNQCCNKCVYCWEGFKKMFIKTPKVNSTIHTVEYMDTEESIDKKLLFKTKQQGLRDSTTVPGNPVNLLCLNINSYAGGLKNIWLNAQYEEGYRKYDSHPPSFSDGYLEILSFNSILGIGSERLVPGQATRLVQTNGPMKLNFKISQPLRTYFQVDGQYYSISNPISVSIKQSSNLINGKIKVLINKEGIVQ